MAMDRLAEKTTWTLPSQLSERVAPALLVSIYTAHRMAVSFARAWIESKGLQRNYIGHEMMMMSMVRAVTWRMWLIWVPA